MQDASLISRIAGGDLIAIEVMYHSLPTRTSTEVHRELHVIPVMLQRKRYFIAELVSYIEGNITNPIPKLNTDTILQIHYYKKCKFQGVKWSHSDVLTSFVQRAVQVDAYLSCWGSEELSCVEFQIA